MFGDGRVSTPQHNLQNCTWHRDNLCCTQQDVMAAFQDLRGVGLDLDTPPGGMCREVMTYVMCHFCAYESRVWNGLLGGRAPKIETC